MSTLIQIKAIATRSQSTLVQDTVGATALIIMLLVALHVPSFI